MNGCANPEDCFTMACDSSNLTPHLLIWAKLGDFDYWPAKLMWVDGERCHCRFFQDHTFSDKVLAENCYLYSKQHPQKIKKSQQLEDAIKVSVFILNFD